MPVSVSVAWQYDSRSYGARRSPHKPAASMVRCGARHQLRLLNVGPIGDSGQVDSRRWDERYAGAEFEWTRQPNQWVAAELAELPPGHALDLAAGEGRNSVWLAERGWQVTAVDFSRVGLEKGRKLSAARGVIEDQVTWIVADLSDYQPEPGAFDLV